MFLVYLKKKDATPPSTIPHYIVARNGIFIKKKAWWMEATVPVKRIAVLEEQEKSCTLMFPAIDALVLAKAWAFFKLIYKKYGSESAVLIHYSATHGWALTVPEQEVMFSRVKYKMTDRLAGHEFMGTMHSHSSMPAFHSGIDTGDEAEMDGVHITFGNVDKPDKFSLDPEVVINGSRFTLPLSKMAGVSEVAEKIVEEKALPKVPLNGTRRKYLAYLPPATPMYTITCSELGGWEVPEEWVSKVSPIKEKPQALFDWTRFVAGDMADENPADGIPLSKSKKEGDYLRSLV